MRPLVIIPVAFGVVALLALASKEDTSQSVESLAKAKKGASPKFAGLPIANPTAYYSAADAWLSGKSGAEQAAQTIDELNTLIAQGFAQRKAFLPSDASPSHIDSYGHEGVWLYRWGIHGITNSHTVTVVDEYGRLVAGVKTEFGTTLLTTAQAILPYVPGIGTAASVALATAIAIGQGKSVKDAALAGARAALPGPAQLAFDLGVAVASGTPIDQAAKTALIKQIPGGQSAYEQGKTLAQQAGVKAT